MVWFVEEGRGSEMVRNGEEGGRGKKKEKGVNVESGSRVRGKGE